MGSRLELSALVEAEPSTQFHKLRVQTLTHSECLVALEHRQQAQVDSLKQAEWDTAPRSVDCWPRQSASLWKFLVLALFSLAFSGCVIHYRPTASLANHLICLWFLHLFGVLLLFFPLVRFLHPAEFRFPKEAP